MLGQKQDGKLLAPTLHKSSQKMLANLSEGGKEWTRFLEDIVRAKRPASETPATAPWRTLRREA